MIPGTVNSRHEAVVPLRIRGPGGVIAQVESIVDTGFTSSLTLPDEVIVSLGLVRQSGGAATLADGSVRRFEICAAEVEWNGAWRAVLVYAIGNESLLGMHLLANHRLAIDVVADGTVEISPLPNGP